MKYYLYESIRDHSNSAFSKGVKVLTFTFLRGYRTYTNFAVDRPNLKLIGTTDSIEYARKWAQKRANKFKAIGK